MKETAVGFSPGEFILTETAKNIMLLQKKAYEMDLEIISIRVPQKNMMRRYLEPTYPERFLGINIGEHEDMLQPKF